ncbi:MAG: hypothetical protein J2O46_03290, partial [Nocardioides sp.]|nr:hypothetical protein [Nocardioides sp.]
MRSQHRAPLVAYAIVAIVGLFVIMQTLSPDVMALQRVPRTLTGHGAYRIEDPAPPLSPQPSTAGASAPARTPEAGPSPTSSAGDPSAMPGTSTVPAAHGKRRHSSAPGTPSAGSSGHTAAPPVQTPPATIYLLPPVGNLPGVPLPVQPEPPLSQVLDGLAPTGDGQSGDGASGNGAGQGQDKGQEQPPGKAVKTLTKAAKSAGK